jgi:3-methyl-2-oxobutanoate hydroxymethyltransferase
MKEKIKVSDIIQKKGKGKIVAITCYDALIGEIEDKVGFDIILVGDSVSNTLLGNEDTLRIGMDEMIIFAKAVSKKVKRALLVGDMPFASFQISKERALENALRFIKEGYMDAVKIEGGKEFCETIKYIVKAGIPVMGHIGLLPQFYLSYGFKVKGKKEEERKKLLEDAKILEDAGVFAIVLEGIYEDIAKEITENLKIPTIGIGAGRFCDGQILVVYDILGLTPPPYPKFVKNYTNLREIIERALLQYKEEVISGKYPEEKYIY